MTQLEIMPQPPESRPASAPWPTYPMLYRVTSAHEEGGVREYAVSTLRFVGDGAVSGLEIVNVEFTNGTLTPVAGTERVLPAQAVFLAMWVIGAQDSSVFQVNLTIQAFVGLAAPLLGIAFAFDAVNGERSNGTLPRLISQPIYRDDIINGKFAGALAVIGQDFEARLAAVGRIEVAHLVV